MKYLYYILFLVLILLPASAMTQTPEPGLKQEFNKPAGNQKNSIEKLYNEFDNRRRANLTPNSKLIPHSEQMALDSLVSEMNQLAPQTFEFHYAQYINSNRHPAQFHHLEKAYQLIRGKADLYFDFIAHYELTSQPVKKQEYIRKLYASGNISQAIYDYNFNVLQSVEENSVLFTNGTLDTYSLWVLQSINKIRPDVTILNFDLLQNEDYRKETLNSLDIGFNHNELSSVSSFLKLLLESHTIRPVYFGLTVPPNLIDSLKQNLYVTGLTLKYAEKEFDNLEVLRENWETTFRKPKVLIFENYQPALLPHTNSSFTPSHASPFRQRDLNSNYLIPLLLLYKYYYEKNDLASASEIKSTALILAATEQEKTAVSNFISKMGKR